MLTERLQKHWQESAQFRSIHISMSLTPNG